jgi:hypothetical protein
MRETKRGRGLDDKTLRAEIEGRYLNQAYKLERL